MFNTLFVVAALATLAVQYRTRLRRRSVAVGITAVVGAHLVASAWPMPFLAPVRLVPDWARDERALTVAVDGARIYTHTPPILYRGSETTLSRVSAPVRIDGIPSGWSAGMAVIAATLRLQDGATLSSLPAGTSTLHIGGGGPELPPVIAEDLLGVRVLRDITRIESEPRATLFLIEEREVVYRGVARGEYLATLRIPLTHYGVEGVLPIAPGATHQLGGYRLVVADIAQRDGDVAIIARESRAASMWERRPWAAYAFYLRNRARGEAVSVNDFDLFSRSALGNAIPLTWGFHMSMGFGGESNGFMARGIALSRPPWVSNRLLEANWISDAELVIVRRTDEGWVQPTLSIPAFPLGVEEQRATTSR